MDDNRRKISESMSLADNEVVDVREMIKSFDKEIKVSTKGLMIPRHKRKVLRRGVLKH